MFGKCIPSCIHPMLKHSTNAAAFVNALNHGAKIMLKAQLNFILCFYVLDIWGRVHFISACCRMWINVQLPVFDNWIWVLILITLCLQCSILWICNRVNHVPGMLSYKHDAVTWIMDYIQVTRIFWKKKICKYHQGINLFCLLFNFIVNDCCQKYIWRQWNIA